MSLYFTKHIRNHLSSVESLLQNEEASRTLEEMITQCVTTFQNRGRLLFCGNGGSAADAQHLAAELSGRFYLNRPALDAEALHTNSSYITAVGNDFDFDTIYERSIEAKGRKGDILIALSTSGRSKNVLRACKMANKMGISVFGFTGKNGFSLKESCDLCLMIDNDDTPRIQELTMLLGHILCEQIESRLFS